MLICVHIYRKAWKVEIRYKYCHLLLAHVRDITKKSVSTAPHAFRLASKYFKTSLIGIELFGHTMQHSKERQSQRTRFHMVSINSTLISTAKRLKCNKSMDNETIPNSTKISDIEWCKKTTKRHRWNLFPQQQLQVIPIHRMYRMLLFEVLLAIILKRCHLRYIKCYGKVKSYGYAFRYLNWIDLSLKAISYSPQCLIWFPFNRSYSNGW